MFRHLLIPTDGSPRSARAAAEGVRLAQGLGARVTGLHVACAYASKQYVPALASQKLKRLVAREADRALEPLVARCRQAGVACETCTVLAGEPWQAILRTARSRGCDVIVMASHGRGTLATLLLGSETSRVIARSKIPVLVVR